MAYAFMIEPQQYIALESEDELIEKCQEWGLLSGKATKLKTFYYKGNGLNLPCTILGYVDHMAAVIQLDNDQKHCIHPSYLKEMQASSYSARGLAGAGTVKVSDSTTATTATVTSKSEPSANDEQNQEASAPPTVTIPSEYPDMDYMDDEDHRVTGLVGDPDGLVEEYIGPQNSTTADAKPKAKTASKSKAIKIDLPDGKVKMSAVVKEFTTVPNHFSDNDDEVIIYEAVAITEPELIEIGEAWSSHSATMKKQELEVGDILSFEGKIIKKKLTRNPVPYKINNPSKIQKEG
ncbi:hypothetical protein [Paenibacillus tundrae]